MISESLYKLLRDLAAEEIEKIWQEIPTIVSRLVAGNDLNDEEALRFIQELGNVRHDRGEGV